MSRRVLTKQEQEHVASMLEDLRYRKMNQDQRDFYRSIESYFDWDKQLSDSQITHLERFHRNLTRAVYGTALSDSDRINAKLNAVFNQMKNGPKS